MKTPNYILALCGMLFLSANVRAEDEVHWLGKAGKLLFEDDFNRTEVQPKWRVGMGFWSIEKGQLAVEENPANKHGAYAYANPGFEYKDFVAEYSFRFDGAKSCDLKIEDSNYKASHAGHIVRVSITPTAVQLGDSKNGTMENEFYDKYNAPSATPEQKKALMATIKDTLASFKVDFDASQWHKARVELVDDEVLLSIDGKVVGYLKAPGVAHPTKNLIGFTIGGKVVHLHGVKVWEAIPEPSWAAKRAAVVTGLQKK